MTGGCILSLGCAIKWFLHSTPTTAREMGKSQSKLSPEQLSDLQKHTYCERPQQTLPSSPISSPPSQLINASFSNGKPISRDPPSSSHKDCAAGTRDSSRTVPPANLTRPSSVEYISSFSRSANPANSPTTYSTSSMRTRVERSTLRSLSAL